MSLIKLLYFLFAFIALIVFVFPFDYRGDLATTELTVALKFTDTESIIRDSNGLKTFDIYSKKITKKQAIPSKGELLKMGNYYITNVLIGNNQFELKMFDHLVQPCVASFHQLPFDGKSISLIDVGSKGYVAWVYETRLLIRWFNIIEKTMDNITIELAPQVKDYASCVGLTNSFVCVYSINLGTNLDCFIQFSDGNAPVNIISERILINQNVYGVKVFLIDKYSSKIVIFFIESSLTLTYITAEISPSKSLLNQSIKKSLIEECSPDVDSFTFGHFPPKYAVVCTKDNLIKIQRIDINFDIISSLITINKSTTTSFNIKLPVLFTLEKTVLFFANPNESKSGYHIFVTPICLTSYNPLAFKNKKIELELVKVLSSETNTDTSIKIIFLPSSPQVTSRTLQSTDNTIIVENSAYPINGIEYISSAMLDDKVSFKLVNEEGLESIVCYFIVKVDDCYPSCSTCSSFSSNPSNQMCTDCNPSYYKMDLDTKENCYNETTKPSGYYLDSDNKYKKCAVNCIQCTNADHCSKCSPNYYLKENDVTPNLCYDASTIEHGHYYLDNNIYKLCDSSCATCSSINCDTCAINYHKKNEPLSTECFSESSMTKGYYIENDLYEKCDTSCFSCSISKSNCLECQSGLYKIYLDPSNQCFNSQTGYFLDTANNVYKQCDIGCEGCQESPSKCISCQPGYHKYRDSSDKINDNCYDDSSKANNFFVNSNNFFQDCDRSCFICTNSPFNCSSCSGTYHKLDGETSNKCYQDSSKEIGYYLDGEVFKPCDSSCNKCRNDAMNCLECSSGYYKKEGDRNINSCYPELSPDVNGYYFDGNMFKFCDKSCIGCLITSKMCRQCAPDFNWYDDKKEICTKNKQYSYVNNGIFYPCYISCDTCSGSGTPNDHNCLFCRSNFYHIDGGSVTNCHQLSEYPDHFINNNLISQTPPLFKKGDSCNRCPIGQYCLEGTIECKKKTEKPLNGYIDEMKNAIFLCQSTCESCHSSSACDTCSHFLFFDNKISQCVNSCLGSLYSYKNKESYKYCVTTCPQYTIAQDSPNPKICKLCKDDEYYYDTGPDPLRDCIRFKPPQTYVSNEEFNVLQPCDVSCAECNYSATNCTICAPNYAILIDDPTNCNSFRKKMNFYFYNPSTFKFEKCHQNCETCSTNADIDNTNCLTCKSGYIENPIKKGNCEHKCPTGEYFYIEKATKEYKCTASCPSAYPIQTISKQCVATCKESGLQLFFYNGECLQDCPFNTVGTIDDLVCHDLNNVNDLLDSISLIILDVMRSRSRLRGLNQIGDYVRLMIPGIKFQLYTYAESLKEEFIQDVANKELSLLDLTECVSYIKNVFSLYDDEIFIVSFEKEIKSNVSPQIEYMLYSSEGRPIDLSYCSKSKLTINQPIIKTDNIRRAQVLYDEYGYNILNSTDPFYTSICNKIKGTNNTDVLLKYRFYYYANISLCEKGCILSNINLVNERSVCICNCKTEFDLSAERVFMPPLVIKTNDTALNYMECCQNVFSINIFSGNIGNYIALSALVLQISTCILFFLQKEKIMLSMISKKLPISASPPKRTGIDQIINYIENQIYNDNNQNEVSNSVNNGIGEMNGIEKEQEQDEIREIEHNKIIINREIQMEPEENNNEMMISNELNLENELVNNEEIENNEDKNKSKMIHTNDDNNINNQEYTIKEFNSIRQRKRPEILVLNQNFMGDLESFENKKKATVKFEDSIIKRDCEVVKNQVAVYDNTVINNTNGNINNNHARIPDQSDSLNLRCDEDSNNLDKPFRREIKNQSIKFGFTSVPIESSERQTYKSNGSKMINKDKLIIESKEILAYKNKAFCLIYLHILQKRHKLINLILNQESCLISIIRLSYFLLAFGFDFFFSTLFCSNSMIEYIYLHQNNETGKILGFGVLTSFIGFILMKIVSWAMNNKVIFTKVIQLRKESDENTFNREFSIRMKMFKRKFVLYYVMVIMFFVLVWYTMTAFCGTFPNSQQLWGTMLGVSAGISLLFPFIYYFIVSLILYLSVQSNSVKVLNFCKLALRVY